MFPQRMVFTDEEKQAVLSFAQRVIDVYSIPESEAVVTAPVTFHCYSTSLGDVTTATCGGFSLNFGYDDDKFYQKEEGFDG